ncbi:hypothetical protein E3U43_020946 [Larimichthys crocea]|uniref:Uncharacterized protein n=1 Tax=Larimichthys crocea TaxID=215358 RepID=A0ACD3Q6Z8_LARCR|nr:hypothetical protein E3U43_020946 [Larimichthys crocea]
MPLHFNSNIKHLACTHMSTSCHDERTSYNVALSSTMKSQFHHHNNSSQCLGYHIPLTLSQQGLLGVLLGEGEHDRLRRLVTLSQMHPRSLAPQVVKLTSRSILPTNL